MESTAWKSVGPAVQDLEQPAGSARHWPAVRIAPVLTLGEEADRHRYNRDRIRPDGQSGLISRWHQVMIEEFDPGWKEYEWR